MAKISADFVVPMLSVLHLPFDSHINHQKKYYDYLDYSFRSASSLICHLGLWRNRQRICRNCKNPFLHLCDSTYHFPYFKRVIAYLETILVKSRNPSLPWHFCQGEKGLTFESFEKRKVSNDLDVNHLVVSRCSSFHDSLAHGWVRVNGFNDFVTGGFQFANRNKLGYHFCNIGANHMTAQ